MKGGFIVAGQYGDGALRERGRTVGYSGRSLHRWAFRRVLRRSATCCSFIDNDSLRYLDKSDGWELGTGPSLVVLDKGFGKNLSTTTLQKGVYAYIFDQKGLMGGIGIQGSKITKITPGQ